MQRDMKAREEANELLMEDILYPPKPQSYSDVIDLLCPYSLWDVNSQEDYIEINGKNAMYKDEPFSKCPLYWDWDRYYKYKFHRK